MLAAARAQNVELANQLALRYKEQAGKSGRAAAVQRLREYEQAITIRGADLSKEDVERNKATAAVLASLRKVLAK